MRLWDVAPCSLLEIYRRFRGAYCLRHYKGDNPKARSHVYILTLTWNERYKIKLYPQLSEHTSTPTLIKESVQQF